MQCYKIFETVLFHSLSVTSDYPSIGPKWCKSRQINFTRDNFYIFFCLFLSGNFFCHSFARWTFLSYVYVDNHADCVLSHMVLALIYSALIHPTSLFFLPHNSITHVKNFLFVSQDVEIDSIISIITNYCYPKRWRSSKRLKRMKIVLRNWLNIHWFIAPPDIMPRRSHTAVCNKWKTDPD